MAVVFNSNPVPLKPVVQAAVNPIEAVGRSFPLGATVLPGGVNFSLFSRSASDVELLSFDREDDALPARGSRLDPSANRSYHHWHVYVVGVQPGPLYGYQVQGPRDPQNGLQFDSSKVLLDPYGCGVAVPRDYSRQAASWEGDNTATAMKSVVLDPRTYDREGDKPLQRPAAQTIIYEMHVRGFTRHPNSGLSEKNRGTYAGLIEKIPYLKELGVNCRRTAASVPVRCSGFPARTGQLLGLYTDLVLCAAPGLQLASRSTRPCARVSRHWSRRCTVRASKLFLTSFSIIQRTEGLE